MFPDAENSGGDADLSLRLVGICRKKAAGFPLPSFRDSPFLFLCPAFAILTGALKHLFTEPPSRTPNGEKHGQFNAPNKDAAFAMCPKMLHVDTWPGVIGHGAFESGVYFENGRGKALRFVFFS